MPKNSETELPPWWYGEIKRAASALEHRETPHVNVYVAPPLQADAAWASCLFQELLGGKKFDSFVYLTREYTEPFPHTWVLPSYGQAFRVAYDTSGMWGDNQETSLISFLMFTKLFPVYPVTPERVPANIGNTRLKDQSRSLLLVCDETAGESPLLSAWASARGTSLALWGTP
jgi:hypothetical protein